MALSIDDPETDRLAQELSSLTGESIAELGPDRAQGAARADTRRGASEEKQRIVEGAMAIARRCSSKPLLDPRTPDEIIGYDENGLPT